MNIQVLKLITNEEILGEIESESETEIVVCNPVGIAIVRGKDNQPKVGLAPFPIHGEEKSGKTFAFAKKHIVYSYVPAEDFVNNYNQIFGSGIVLPSKTLITG
jgi:hypothetical protein